MIRTLAAEYDACKFVTWQELRRDGVHVTLAACWAVGGGAVRHMGSIRKGGSLRALSGRYPISEEDDAPGKESVVTQGANGRQRVRRTGVPLPSSLPADDTHP